MNYPFRFKRDVLNKKGLGDLLETVIIICISILYVLIGFLNRNIKGDNE